MFYLLFIRHGYPAALLLMCAVLFTGCATVRPHDQDAEAIGPTEKIDHAFTDGIDRNVLAPVADAYVDHVPAPMQRSIGNFYDNLAYPNVILNDFLQGKVRQGFQDTLRLAVNSTIGGVGLFDMASPMGLLQHDEDFWQTLEVWGFDPKSYLYIPWLGLSSPPDTYSMPVSVLTNILTYVGTGVGPLILGFVVTVPLAILGMIDARARLSGPLRLRDQAALDPYLFARDSYLQERKHLIYEGNPPPESYDDLSGEELPARSLH